MIISSPAVLVLVLPSYYRLFPPMVILVLASCDWNIYIVVSVMIFRWSNEVTLYSMVDPSSFVLKAFMCHNEVSWRSEWSLVEVKVPQISL